MLRDWICQQHFFKVYTELDSSCLQNSLFSRYVTNSYCVKIVFMSDICARESGHRHLGAKKNPNELEHLVHLV